MALTEEEIEHYYREGYVVARGLVPPPVVDAVVEAAKGRVRTGDKWQPTIFDHAALDADAAVHRLLVEPAIVAAVEQLLGTPPRVYYGMLAVVPAHGGNGLPWHQDNQYSHLLGGALNTFVALCEITPDKANLWLAPQTHRAGVQPSKTNDTSAPGHREALVEPENGIVLPTLQPGDACIFDRSTYHRSLQNHTAEPRFAYAAQYQADHARQAWDGKKDPIRMHAADLAARWSQRPAGPL
jgi:ectoine hydroxylase-related dioxygenase (phytanoyl-CoA dioxygenase family)